jgi:hypothetical protein
MGLRGLIIHGDDNVANLIGAGTTGARVDCAVDGSPSKQTILLAEDIPANHKFARADIKAGQPIIKYGLSIGEASCNIRRGQSER